MEVINDLSECLLIAFDEANAAEWLLESDDEEADWYALAEQLEKQLHLHGYEISKTTNRE